MRRVSGWWDLVSEAFKCLIEIIRLYDSTKYYKIPTECTIIAVFSSELYWYFIAVNSILLPHTVSMR
jgi:hypothetical protein